MTYLAFERDLLVVQLLDVHPVIHFEFDGLREAFPEINFNTYAGACLHVIFWLTAINKSSNSIPNGSNRFVSPTVERKVREPNLDWDCTRDIQFGVEIRSPFVEI